MKMFSLFLALAFALTVFSVLKFDRSAGNAFATQDGKVRAIERLDVEKRILELGLELPTPSKSLAIYKRAVVVDNLIYLSGHIPVDSDGKVMTGKVGSGVDVKTANAAAQQCALALLASMKEELGSLNKVKRIVKTTGMVNCNGDFAEQPEVINGFSQVFVDIFGEDNGKGARAAVGMASLPRRAICEIEAIFELHPQNDGASD